MDGRKKTALRSRRGPGQHGRTLTGTGGNSRVKWTKSGSGAKRQHNKSGNSNDDEGDSGSSSSDSESDEVEDLIQKIHESTPAEGTQPRSEQTESYFC
jgi:hypothetical protein